MEERRLTPLEGWNALAVEVAAVAAAVVLAVVGAAVGSSLPIFVAIAIVVVVVIGVFGFFVNQPNQAKVLTLFGRYTGTVRETGFWWVNPLAQRRPVSLRIRNFDSDTLKVNDAVGNPVEIAAVINWQIADTAKAVFDVDSYQSFVEIQTE